MIKVIKVKLIYNTIINIKRYKVINRQRNRDWYRYSNI